MQFPLRLYPFPFLSFFSRTLAEPLKINAKRLARAEILFLPASQCLVSYTVIHRRFFEVFNLPAEIAFHFTSRWAVKTRCHGPRENPVF